MKITQEAHIFWLLHSMVKLIRLFRQKWVGLHFGPIFHLATLLTDLMGVSVQPTQTLMVWAMLPTQNIKRRI
jgi:hypothetical protein